MAAILTENFDSYSDGDLNGQGSWSGSVQYDIQGSVVQGGTKAVICQNNPGSGYQIVKAGTSLASGNQLFYMRWSALSNNTDQFFTTLREGATKKFRFNFKNVAGDYQAQMIGATTVTNGTGLSANTWYKVEIEWDGVGQTGRFRLNDGTWSSTVAPISSFTNLDTIELESYTTTGDLTYWDSFSGLLPSSSSQARLLGLLGIGS